MSNTLWDYSTLVDSYDKAMKDLKFIKFLNTSYPGWVNEFWNRNIIIMHTAFIAGQKDKPEEKPIEKTIKTPQIKKRFRISKDLIPKSDDSDFYTKIKKLILEQVRNNVVNKTTLLSIIKNNYYTGYASSEYIHISKKIDIIFNELIAEKKIMHEARKCLKIIL